VRHAVAEVSSQGIAEGRVEALNFRACMFTNLGPTISTITRRSKITSLRSSGCSPRYCRAAGGADTVAIVAR